MSQTRQHPDIGGSPRRQIFCEYETPDSLSTQKLAGNTLETVTSESRKGHV